jgi:cytidine deaminase
VTDEDLIQIATKLVGEFRTSEDCVAGGVAAALVTRTGNIFTGICIDTACSLGFCAEHAAVAEMWARESEIDRIVAVTEHGTAGAPCGGCRELLWQVSVKNSSTRIILAPNKTITLEELLPLPWPR